MADLKSVDLGPIPTVTKSNVTNSQMGDIRAAMEIYGVSEEEAFAAYNRSLQIPFNQSVLDDWNE